MVYPLDVPLAGSPTESHIFQRKTLDLVCITSSDQAHPSATHSSFYAVISPRIARAISRPHEYTCTSENGGANHPHRCACTKVATSCPQQNQEFRRRPEQSAAIKYSHLARKSSSCMWPSVEQQRHRDSLNPRTLRSISTQ